MYQQKLDGAKALEERYCLRRLWLEWRWYYPVETNELAERRNAVNFAITNTLMQRIVPTAEYTELTTNNDHIALKTVHLETGDAHFVEIPRRSAAFIEMQTSVAWLSEKYVVPAFIAGADDTVIHIYNTSDGDLERISIPVDHKVAERALAKLGALVGSTNPPPRLPNENDLQCNVCPGKAVCRENKIHDITCRSCYNSVPDTNGTWYCKIYSATIPEHAIIQGCDKWQLIPEVT